MDLQAGALLGPELPIAFDSVQEDIEELRKMLKERSRKKPEVPHDVGANDGTSSYRASEEGEGQGKVLWVGYMERGKEGTWERRLQMLLLLKSHVIDLVFRAIDYFVPSNTDPIRRWSAR